MQHDFTPRYSVWWNMTKQLFDRVFNYVTKQKFNNKLFPVKCQLSENVNCRRFAAFYSLKKWPGLTLSTIICHQERVSNCSTFLLYDNRETHMRVLYGEDLYFFYLHPTHPPFSPRVMKDNMVFFWLRHFTN